MSDKPSATEIVNEIIGELEVATTGLSKLQDHIMATLQEGGAPPPDIEKHIKRAQLAMAQALDKADPRLSSIRQSDPEEWRRGAEVIQGVMTVFATAVLGIHLGRIQLEAHVPANGGGKSPQFPPCERVLREAYAQHKRIVTKLEKLHAQQPDPSEVERLQ